MLVGTGMGGLTVFSDGVQALIEKGHRKITPFFIPYAITNMGSALLAIDIGFMGPNYSISTACATSNYCFYAAANHIRRGEADMMLAGGTEAAIIPIGLGGFVACRALSQRNDDPKTASRPWDRDRDGFVMGEGAGILVSFDVYLDVLCKFCKDKLLYLAFTWTVMYSTRKMSIHFLRVEFHSVFDRIPNLFEDNSSGSFYPTGYGEFGACNETWCTNSC